MSLWSWIKSLFVTTKKKAPDPRFVATPIDLLMGVDYSISSWHDSNGVEWAKITLLKGLYKDVSFKFNKLALKGVDEKQASMEMDYDFIEYAGFPKDILERNDQFQNVVFNIAFSLLMSMNLGSQNNDNNDNEDDDLYVYEEEDSGSSEIPGRNNSGKPDSE